MTLDEAADELYALAPSDFIAARKTLAARTRTGGDRPLAAEIAALQKPSAGAWAVNRLVRDERAALESLVELGTRFRAAEEKHDRDAVIALTKERKSALADLAARAASVTADAGHTLNAGAREELAQSLRAAIADAGAATAVLTGRLVTGLSADGVQAVDVGHAVAGSTPPPTRKPSSTSSAAADRRRAAETAAADAEDAWADAKTDLAALQKKSDSLSGSVDDLTAERDRLERELQDAQRKLDAAQADADGIDGATAAAVERERSARTTATRARTKADRLD